MVLKSIECSENMFKNINKKQFKKISIHYISKMTASTISINRNNKPSNHTDDVMGDREKRRVSHNKSQARYYEKNKNIIAERHRDSRKQWARDNYNDAVKKQKQEYHLRNRNYRNQNFAVDLDRMFSNPPLCF
jgi:hypothetical protein